MNRFETVNAIITVNNYIYNPKGPAFPSRAFYTTTNTTQTIWFFPERHGCPNPSTDGCVHPFENVQVSK